MGYMNDYAISVIRLQQREAMEHYFRLLAFEALFRRYWVEYPFEPQCSFTV